MHMMMMQNQMDNDQKEQQNRIDTKEQREWEYQLCWEEMAIAHKEACEQRKFMNLLLPVPNNLPFSLLPPSIFKLNNHP